jgi:predicted ATP-dependent endonuclease of OLD family
VIYLIEEPETFLHPSAQNDLLNALQKLSAPQEFSGENQVIITTHSPVFAGATYIESVILCKKENGSVYENYTANGKEEFLSSIIDELGIKPSYNLRDSYEKIVFVEGPHDTQFYDIICQKLIGERLDRVNTILVLFGGGKTIDNFVNIEYFDKSGRELYLLIDSDKHKNKYDEQRERAKKFQDNKKKGKAYVLKKSCPENYYHPRAFERVYDLSEGSFPDIADDENVKTVIKQYKDEHGVTKNIKEKNNFDVFDAMTEDEWEAVVEPELIAFLRDIVTQ